MAWLHLDHLPVSVKMNLPLNLILPDPGEMKGIPVRDRKVLYLLHGLSDDGSAWQRYSAIELYARKYGLVVVMPSAGRSFYLDQPNGQGYFTYLVEELPRYLEEVFGIVAKRENTMIAGLSMGGYGAMKAALLHPEQYSAAASFSGVLVLNYAFARPDDPNRTEFETLFGDLSKVPGSLHNPLIMLQKVASEASRLPRLYVSCGLQDDLYPMSLVFRDTAKELGIPVDYFEGEGKHDWYFWNAQIQRFLEMELEPGTSIENQDG